MDGEKERRNLLVISTAVLLFFWLDLPEGMISERVFGQKIEGQIDAWRLWVAVTILICYQAHRFYSVSIGSAFSNEVKAVFRVWRREVVRDALEMEMTSLSSGRQDSPVMFCGGFSRNEFPENVTDAAPVDWKLVVFKDGYVTHFDESCWTGSQRISLQTKTQRVVGGEEFSFPNGRRIWVDICLVPRFFNTKFFSEYGVPIMLAYVALWFAIYRVSGLLW